MKMPVFDSLSRMRLLALFVTVAGCGTRPLNPCLPPETQYSTGSTVAAIGGLLGTAIGTDLAQNSRNSPNTRAIGTAAAATGMGLLAVALIDAVEVQKQREKVINIDRAMRHSYMRPGVPDSFFRPPPPPLPDPPFNFDDEP